MTRQDEIRALVKKRLARTLTPEEDRRLNELLTEEPAHWGGIACGPDGCRGI